MVPFLGLVLLEAIKTINNTKEISGKKLTVDNFSTLAEFIDPTEIKNGTTRRPRTNKPILDSNCKI
jgi:exopolysaccharide biosynthesis protein